MYILCQFVVLPLYLGFLAYCPSADVAGITVSYPGDDAGGAGFSAAHPKLSSACNAGCAGGCAGATDFDPVCGSLIGGEEVTFFNPCYAGCSASSNTSHFLDCGCSGGEAATVQRGICQSARSAGEGSNDHLVWFFLKCFFFFRCDFTYFSIFLFLQIFFTFVATMPGLMAGLR